MTQEQTVTVDDQMISVNSDEYHVTPTLPDATVTTESLSETKINLTLPSKSDTAALDTFLVNIHEQHNGVYGTKSLQRNLSKYLIHHELAERLWNRVEKSVNFVTGVRTSGQKKAGTTYCDKCNDDIIEWLEREDEEYYATLQLQDETIRYSLTVYQEERLKDGT